ncbi:carboxypeptidase regulatory-like domain-containing protein, partial [Acidobacteriota bacterium]
MKRKLVIPAFLIAALAMFGGFAAAQESTTGSIEGTVMDTDGTALPGASATLSSVSGDRTIQTDMNGKFRFVYLTPGTFDITVQMDGFNTVERKGIELRLGAAIRLEITISRGVVETMEVVGETPVVNLVSSTTGANITSDMFTNVPVGRTVAGTLALAPGVVESGIDSSNPSIAGASGLENTYMVDGVNIGNTGYGSMGSYSIVFGALGTGVNFDYIQEVQIKTGGYEPEFGEALGGYVNLITKSGGNDLKGSTYMYYTPGAVEGEREDPEVATAAAKTTEYHSFDIGAEMGGPLSKDKAFVYGAFNPTWTKRKRITNPAI